MNLINQDLKNFDDRYNDLFESSKLNGITTVDLLIKSPTELSKLLKRSIIEVESLKNEILSYHQPASYTIPIKKQRYFTTGMAELDDQLHGGIRLGEITEIFGSSGCGKSQLLYQISCYTQLSQRYKVIFITTESFLETKRLQDMIDHINEQNEGSEVNKVSLDNILYYYCADLETQHHILYNQLPLQLEDSSIQTLIIDSIGHHLRHEQVITTANFLKQVAKEKELSLDDNTYLSYVKQTHNDKYSKFFRFDKTYDINMNKKYYYFELFRHLNRLCSKFDISIVVANQVSDQLSNYDPEYEPSNDSLDLDYQLGHIVGWDSSTILSYQKIHNGTRDDNNNPNFDYSNEIRQKTMNGSTEPSSTVSNPVSHTQNANNNSMQDPRYLPKTTSFTTNSHDSYKFKYHAPTLGYHWMKLVDCKISLSKKYQVMADNKRKLHEGWEVKRSMKVVNDNSSTSLNFEISTGGLKVMP
ncbi:DNA repair protein Rad57p [[Candida] jaroonii]|uniref:DNA repair protein Rad57p n=1 Tax=[Candida] jaroonii TaxID=467808 RepID=A0ACA9Y4B5_9ASCO|nr:DNA repair protein Rad57p [[Candida] jaroonii]